jgi:excisionase family DNA binding protein
MKEPKKYISVKEIAEYLEVSKQTVNKWIKENKIKSYHLPSGRKKVLRDDFITYLEKNKLPVDPDIFPTKKKKLIVIDDDDKIINLFQRYFQKVATGWHIEYALDGMTGLLKIGIYRPDVVILDIEMPGMDGIEVCKKMQQDERLAHIKVIIISGFTTIYEEDLQKLGVATILEKPFTFSELNEKLSAFLQ